MILLDSKPYGSSLFLRPICYTIMFKGYLLVNDHKNWIECGKKCLVFLHAFDTRAQQGWATIRLGKLFEFKYQFQEAEQLYEL